MVKALKPLKGCQYSELASHPSDPHGLSFKIDGIRAMIYGDCQARSTTGKLLPNEHLQREFKLISSFSEGLDGEIVVGEPNDPNVFQASSSFTMSKANEADFHFYVFDDFSEPDLPFHVRYANYKRRVKGINAALVQAGCRPFLKSVEYVNIESDDQYLAMKRLASEKGYEGLYGKLWQAPYKHGRSTPKQGWVWKDKPWADEEGIVIGVEEMMHNANEAKVNDLGYTTRSTAKDGLVPSGFAGALVVVNPKYGNNKFRVSLGSVTMDERKRLWDSRDTLTSSIVKYKFFDFGVVNVPRSAIFCDFRPEIDVDSELLSSLKEHANKFL